MLTTPPATKLCEIANKYRCDKAPQVMHNYTPFYHKLFGPTRWTIKRIFEIGIGTVETMVNVPGYQVGASAYMWRDFLPSAEIFAIDIEPRVMLDGRPGTERIHTYLCDQAQSGLLCSLIDRLGGNFDFIIDDGSHILDHQIISAIALIPYVKEGGVYIVEDVRYPDVLAHQLGRFGYKAEVHAFDKTQVDDCLIVVSR